MITEKTVENKNYWKNIEDGLYPYFDIAEEFVKILEEESKNEKYSNYDGYFRRSIGLNEVKRRVEKWGITSSIYYR